MNDIPLINQNKSLYFSWIPDVFIHPRKAFQRISTYSSAIWLTPLLILSVAVLINVIIVGKFKSQAALMGEITYSPDFQYYTPEEQAQYIQAAQSTQKPVFIYVLPAIGSLFGVWFGWLILGGIVHLVSTLLGGRGSTAISMNVVAWASIPLALREFVQIIYMLITQNLISNPGLSGFSSAVDSGFPLFLGHILGFIDLYLIWHTILIILGVRLSTGINATKAFIGVIISVLVIILIQSGLAYLGSVLGNLTITRPFFF